MVALVVEATEVRMGDTLMGTMTIVLVVDMQDLATILQPIPTGMIIQV